jgi:hypothetical protein
VKFHNQLLPPGEADQLWLMLPGAYMTPGDFIEAGFTDAVRRRGLRHDIALLEANIAELADGTARRFLQDFLRSDAAMLRRRVCLLGISLGAHLAMACLARSSCSPAEAEAAGRIASTCLLAPYLGPRDIIAEAASGRTQPAQPAAQQDIDRHIWHWLQQRPAAGQCDVYLGYGCDDRFAAAHALMAKTLPPSHVDVQPGAHTWPVWTALWNRHLDQVYVSR